MHAITHTHTISSFAIWHIKYCTFCPKKIGIWIFFQLNTHRVVARCVQYIIAGTTTWVGIDKNSQFSEKHTQTHKLNACRERKTAIDVQFLCELYAMHKKCNAHFNGVWAFCCRCYFFSSRFSPLNHKLCSSLHGTKCENVACAFDVCVPKSMSFSFSAKSLINEMNTVIRKWENKTVHSCNDIRIQQQQKCNTWNFCMWGIRVKTENNSF